MDNSEVDLYQMMNVIWAKKKQILLFTALIAVASALISNAQPKYYETQKTAFILKSDRNIYKNQQTWPAEFYENYSKSPGILKAVLENLPKEVRLEENIAPMSYLKTILRVQSQIIPAMANFTTSAIKVTYFARHRDPSSAHKILNTWQNIIENNFSKHYAEVNFGDYSEKKEQLKLAKAKWDEDKKKLADFNESYNISNKASQLNSMHRLLQNARVNFETKTEQLDTTKIHDAKIRNIKKLNAQILSLEEQYLITKETLKEHKLQLNLEPRMHKLITTNNIGISGYKNSQTKTIVNPIYSSLKLQAIQGEANLISLKMRKDYLERKLLRLQSDISNPSLAGNILGIAQNNNQIKFLTKKIKLLETGASNLEKEISEKRIEHRNLNLREHTSANEFVAKLKKFKELELLKTSKNMRLNFSLSSVEPAKFFGPPIQTNMLIASAGGLVLMIFFTLIKDAFSPKREDTNSTRPMDTQYANAFQDGFMQDEGIVMKNALLVTPSKTSEHLKEPKLKYFTASK